MSLLDASIHYRESLGDFEERVLRKLHESFRLILERAQGSAEAPPDGGIVADPEGVADRVAQIITSFSRAEAVPSDRSRSIESIRTRILEYVRKRIPVDAHMLWSPKKHWVQGDENTVDLAELAALQTLLSIDSEVRGVYRCGLSFRLDLEDIEFEFMEVQNEDVVNVGAKYVSGLRRLIKALQLSEVFTIGKVSEHARSGEELRRWRQQLAENHRVLEAYWYESEGDTFATHEVLPSFKELSRLGWKGPIPPEMRRYYLNRLKTLADAPYQERVDMVLRNFAGILLHRQIGLLCGSGLVDPVRFSFVRAADFAPTELLLGRVDLRFVPRKICSRVSAAAPWSTKGFVCGGGNQVKLSFRGWHELANARCSFTEGWFTLPAHDGTAKVRADFLHK